MVKLVLPKTISSDVYSLVSHYKYQQWALQCDVQVVYTCDYILTGCEVCPLICGGQPVPYVLLSDLMKLYMSYSVKKKAVDAYPLGKDTIVWGGPCWQVDTT